MALEIDGKLTKILPEQTGQGAKGPWVRQAFILETKEQYPRQMCFDAWNDKADALKKLALGEDLKVRFNIESREFNEKWYTSLTVWQIDKIGIVPLTGPNAVNRNTTTTTTQPQERTTQQTSRHVENNKVEDEKINEVEEVITPEDDLPF